MKIGIKWRNYLLCLPVIFFLFHLIYVLELGRDPNRTDVPKKHNKFDHLVLGPPAGQGLSNRLQCKGVKALNKTHFSISTRSPNVGDGINFVTVFSVYKNSPNSQLGDKSSEVVTVGSASYTRVERSMAILDVFINFIQVSMPRSNVIILTDPALDISLQRTQVSIFPVEGDYSRERLMLQRIKSYIEFLDRKLEVYSHDPDLKNHYIFTDSDLAVVDDLGKMFTDNPEFDLALTFRNNKEQPLNSGFIAVRGTHDGLLRGKNFLQKVLDAYTSKFMKSSRMLGDQLALTWVVKSHSSFDVRRFSKAHAFLEEIGGALVLFLPCATYNWTPPEGAGQFHGMPLDVKVVHFKGSRKRLMLESWNFFNSSGNISDTLCLILGSGRTKYDF